ncbi:MULTISPECIES: hypothetical protein [Halocynthiibacter]|uniref:Uncharacterized protein n=1 Tax=Halocynthiibacter halioticoli TaxID=2986804 RepID=A0AAE3J0B3_9RHOB|nr:MULTISPECIES: hypothetical protein [Halocynthiibacter]MCV6825400.1 hypothetical protein [Halocynthiibacter halioticoli]MCW4058401.1 hypothetical protein [Halocynthiibacter sp. SDUM655004]
MTKKSLNTQACVTKEPNTAFMAALLTRASAPGSHKTSPTTDTLPSGAKHFAALVDAVQEALLIEEDLLNPLSWDPATDGFYADATAQWQHCLDLSQVYDALYRALGPVNPLWTLGMYLHKILKTEAVDEMRYYQARLQSCCAQMTAAGTLADAQADPALAALSSTVLPRAEGLVNRLVELAEAEEMLLA